MEAVKMPSTVQAKSQIRTQSAKTSEGGDEFMKLLQVKKGEVQPDKTDTKQPDDKAAADEGKEVPENKKEDSGTEKPKEEPVSSGEQLLGQDALLQAAMQQTAAQMAGMVTDTGQKATEPVETEIGAPAEAVLTDTGTETGSDAKQAPEIIQEPAYQQKEADGSQDKGAEQKDGGGFQGFSDRQADTKAPEAPVQVSENRTEVKPQEPAQAKEKTEVQEGYTAASARTEREESFQTQAQRTEEIPLKTSESRLPQDLGRALADRLPGTGRELVVELEPANLGKLTIKMVYEAGRAAVSIIANNPKTMELLSQKAGEIASILEEKTGQETIIYTQAPQEENPEENPDQNRGGQGGRQEHNERHPSREEGRHEAESFAQQLRLGLV